jgi:Flp pilus assembly protein TadG
MRLSLRKTVAPLSETRLPGLLAHRQAAKRSARRGAAAVELAVVAPVLFTLILGIVEFGRAMMVLELLDNAARAGARVGALSGSDTAAITSAVTTNLTNSGVTSTSVAVLVNGSSANANTASTGDTITVSVSVPADQVCWLPVGRFLGGSTLEGTMAMRRE